MSYKTIWRYKMGIRITVVDQEYVDRAKMDLKDIEDLGVAENRLQAIISAYKNGVKNVVEVLDLSRNTLHQWCKDYKEHGIEG